MNKKDKRYQGKVFSAVSSPIMTKEELKSILDTMYTGITMKHGEDCGGRFCCSMHKDYALRVASAEQAESYIYCGSGITGARISITEYALIDTETDELLFISQLPGRVFTPWGEYSLKAHQYLKPRK